MDTEHPSLYFGVQLIFPSSDYRIDKLKMFYQTNHMFAAEITPPQQRQNGPVCCCITSFAATTFHSVTAAGVMGVNSAFFVPGDPGIQSRPSEGPNTPSL